MEFGLRLFDQVVANLFWDDVADGFQDEGEVVVDAGADLLYELFGLILPQRILILLKVQIIRKNAVLLRLNNSLDYVPCPVSFPTQNLVDLVFQFGD